MLLAKHLILTVLLASVILSNTTQVTFDGFRLLRLYLINQAQVDLIGTLETGTDIDVWSIHTDTVSTADVVVSPSSFNKFAVIFAENGIKFEVVHNNIQELIDEQKSSMVRTKNDRSIVGKFGRYEEINAYLDSLAAANPLLVQSKNIGKTFEGRDLKTVIIGTPTAQRSIWIDCGIHAREWISPATCVYFIDYLVTKYAAGDADVTELLKYYTFQILPIHNPDGYAYSWSTYRLWRKNRSINTGSTCVGTDLNRNYGYKWMFAGASNNPCSDTFAGIKADSELETKAVEAAINAKLGKWDAFITIHTYGQWLFTPWGYSPNELPADYTELNNKLRIAAAAIRKSYNSVFTHGSSAQILYAAAGGSDDWAKGVANIKYSYCFELRPGQSGVDAQFGFTLPEDRAPKAGQETTDGLIALLKEIKNNY